MYCFYTNCFSKSLNIGLIVFICIIYYTLSNVTTITRRKIIRTGDENSLHIYNILK